MVHSHRFVYDAGRAKCSVTRLVPQGADGTVDDVGGRVLDAVARGRLALVDAASAFPEFVARASALGWLDRNGLTGPLTRIDGHPALTRLQIELTLACNLRCGYCYSESGPQRREALGYQQVVALLEQAVGLGCVWVDLTGGETLMYPGFDDVLRHATALGLALTVHSNGTALNARWVEVLGASGVRKLQVSLDSHQREVHDAERGRRGAFDKTIAGIRRARDAKLPVCVSLMVHRGNLEHVGDAVTWIRQELGVPVNLDRVVAVGGERSAQRGVTAREFFEAVAPLLSRRTIASRLCDGGGELAPEPHCGVAHSFVYVTAEGEMALCPTMTSRDRPFFAGPRLSQCDLRTAWLESPYFARYRGANCVNSGHCSAGQACGGGCRSNAYLDASDLSAPDFVSCNLHKNPSTRFVDFERRYADLNFAPVGGS